MSENNIRVRYAPSPTGMLHIGGARTALFNWLFARHTGGRFILRIEDTDQSRFVPQALEDITESLRWLALDCDEGPEAGGDYGPYVQSERLDLYTKHAAQLEESGMAYPCFCTEERLAGLREKNRAGGGHSLYDGRCRELSPEERGEKMDAGDPYVLRLRTPDAGITEVTDLLRGTISFENKEINDIILMKADRFPTYHLANIVDDHRMKISHVLRGEEWISSSPVHVILYKAFGWDPPEFVHLPLILSQDGGKMSKRKGAVTVLEFRDNGYLPETMINFLALLGWSCNDKDELFSKEELIEKFSLKRIRPVASRFNREKLDWMNGQYIRKLSAERLYELALPFILQKGLIDKTDAEKKKEWLINVLQSVQERVVVLTEIPEKISYFLRADFDYDKKARKKLKGSAEILESYMQSLSGDFPFDHDGLENNARQFCEESGLKFGKLVHPVRAALSGTTVGPSLFEIILLLGRAECIQRLKRAINWLNRDDTDESAE